MSDQSLVKTRNLTKYYPLKNKQVKALSRVSIEIRRGEMLGCVGESGSGKSTLGKILMGLESPTTGSVTINGTPLSELKKHDPKYLSSIIQYIFQDPSSSLNPRMTVGEIVAEPIVVHNLLPSNKIRPYVANLFNAVNLDPSWSYKYPHELSGGQKQRIGIARALSVNPTILIADEPLSALDVITQESILSLFQSLSKKNKFTSLFISHDLLRTKSICDRIAVMLFGCVVEIASADELFASPKHPYTHALISSIPLSKVEEVPVASTPNNLPSDQGCPFANQCSFAKPICVKLQPNLVKLSESHQVACHLYDERFYSPSSLGLPASNHTGHGAPLMIVSIILCLPELANSFCEAPKTIRS